MTASGVPQTAVCHRSTAWGVSAFVGDVRAFVMDLVRLCTDKYTDTLHSMWLLNTPYVFRAVWAVVSAAAER